jgi:hypothetical protein
MPMSARDEGGPSAPGAEPARARSPRISVIVPVLDEEARIGRQLERLAVYASGASDASAPSAPGYACRGAASRRTRSPPSS